MKTRFLTLVILVSLLFVGLSFPSDAEASTYHTVKPGENLFRIGLAYGVSVAAIQQANGMGSSTTIYVGQRLLIPTGGGSTPPPSTCGQVHIVKPGEYLKVIAARYGVTVSSIVQANNISNPSLIYSGQKLWIPCAGGQPPVVKPPSGKVCYTTHVVKRGEYLKQIANRYGTTVNAIVKVNGIQNPNVIYPGQKLKVPVKCATTPKPTPPPSGSLPWTAQYWNNKLLSGNPTCTTKIQQVNHNWGTKGPGCGIAGTNFSARYIRTRQFNPGLYRFVVTTDDGVRVWIDGILIIDQWHNTAPVTYTATRQLSGGNHSMKIDYFQNTGGAQIRFYPELVTGAGAWTGQYFNNIDLSGDPVVTRQYQNLDFNWGNKSPAPGVTADYFSARYTGEFAFVEDTFRFFATTDDGIRVWLDDEKIIDNWHIGSVRTLQVDKKVDAGKHRLTVEYFENTGAAVLKVRWTQN